jgi:dual 3',5'-cyclic-AMP and -GMP phosphodiesterase 11
VKDICNELEVRSLCHKILQNVSTLLHADRGSLFLVQGEKGGGCTPLPPGQTPRGRCLVSKLFDVCSRSTLTEMEKKEEIRIPWGTGIVGYVAESGEPVNIPDAYQDDRFNHDIDALTGYRTKTLLCMPIKDTNGDVIGVAQVSTYNKKLKRTLLCGNFNYHVATVIKGQFIKMRIVLSVTFLLTVKCNYLVLSD